MECLSDSLLSRVGPAVGAGLLLFTAACFPIGPGPVADGPAPGPDPDPDLPADFCLDLIGLDSDVCVRAIDCGAGSVCFKEEGADLEDFGCCRPVFCLSDADCASGSFCQQDTGLCIDEQRCGVEEDQGGEPCDDDQRCVWQSGTATCGAPAPVACEVSPASLVVGAGGAATFGVLWLDGQDQPLAAPATFDASADVGEVTGTELVAACAGADVCTGSLTVTSGEAQCEATVAVLPDDPATTHIAVFDAVTGAPLDARVHIVDDSGVGTTLETDNGLASVAADALRAVTALAPGHRTLSVLTVPSGNLALPLTPVPEGVAGLRGEVDFSNLLPLVGEIAFGIGGLSIGRPGIDLTLERLLGLDGTYRIPELADIAVDGDPLTRNIPSAVTLNVASNDWKAPLLAIGEPGRRVVWSLASRERLSNAEGFFGVSASTWSQVAALEMLDSVRATVSGISGSLTAEGSPAPARDDDGVLDYDDHQTAITLGDGAVGLTPTQLPYRVVQLSSPELPCVNGSACGERAVAVVGAQMPGRGFVPLGLSARQVGDPLPGAGPTLTEGGPAAPPGVAKVLAAPAHSGLEGQPLSAWLLVFGDRLREDGDGRPLAFMQWPDVGLDTVQPATAESFGPRVVATGETTLSFSATGGDPDMSRHHATLDGAPWELIAAGTPADVDLTALLPVDVTGPIDHRYTQAITLQPGASFAAIVAADGAHLGDLDRWVAASRSDR